MALAAPLSVIRLVVPYRLLDDVEEAVANASAG